ncbi:MAG: DUF4411 family protein [Bacillota bacterium]
MDANVFIEAANRYYAFDLVPAFWQALIDHATNGELLSIDKVKDEITRLGNELTEWAKKDFRWFAPTDQTNTLKAYRDSCCWAQGHAQFSDGAKSQFAGVADGWLVAYAKANDCILVTHEQFAKDVKARIPIPNACRELGLEIRDTFAMLRALSIKLS